MIEPPEIQTDHDGQPINLYTSQSSYYRAAPVRRRSADGGRVQWLALSVFIGFASLVSPVALTAFAMAIKEGGFYAVYPLLVVAFGLLYATVAAISLLAKRY